MLDIEQSIVVYLEQAHKISLPGIGVIRYIYQPADLLRYTRRIIPPRYKIEFIAGTEEPVDDFIQYLSSVGRISESEAQLHFNAFLSRLKEQLVAGQSYSIGQLGTFRYIDQKIVFDEDKDSYLLAYNLGCRDTLLPPPATQVVSAEPVKSVSKTISKSSIPESKVRVPLFVKVGLAVAGIILIVFFILAQTNVSDITQWSTVQVTLKEWVGTLPWFGRSQVKNIDELRKENRQALSIPVKPVDSTRNTAPVDSYQKAVSKQLVYHIIAGSYKNRVNAEQGMTSLQQLGFRPSLLNFNDTLFRVSLVSFSDRQKAVDEYIYISQRYPDLKIWFYSRYE